MADGPDMALSGVRALAQSVVGALPALILVIFAELLSLLGLACEEGRRSYALAYADRSQPSTVLGQDPAGHRGTALVGPSARDHWDDPWWMGGSR